VLSVIDRNNTDISSRHNTILTISAIVFCVMALCLFFMFRYVSRQNTKLMKARQELSQANDELQKSNKKLQWMNDRVMKNNKKLFDMNEELRKEKGIE
jgi:cell shape-determining protein MreC